MGRTIGCSSSSISRVMGICLDLFLGPSKGPIKGKGKASGKTTAIATRKTGTRVAKRHTGSRGAKRQIRGLEGRSGRYGVCDVKQSNEVNLLKRHVILAFWMHVISCWAGLRAVAHPQPSGSAGASKLPICHSFSFSGHAGSQGHEDDKLSNK